MVNTPCGTMLSGYNCMLVAYHAYVPAVCSYQYSTSRDRRMSTKKNKSAAQGTAWWNKNKQRENVQSQVEPAGRGGHFATSSSTVAGSSADAASYASQPGKHAPIKITGASGEMPKVPVRVHASTMKQYSRYNERYAAAQTGKQGSAEKGSTAFTTKAAPGQPAYSWIPFLVYAAICIAASLAWVIVAKLVGAAVLVPGDPMLTLALVLLCAIVVAGIGLILATASITRRSDDELMAADVVASALLKGSLAMFVSAACWMGCLMLVTLTV